MMNKEKKTEGLEMTVQVLVKYLVCKKDEMNNDRPYVCSVAYMESVFQTFRAYRDSDDFTFCFSRLLRPNFGLRPNLIQKVK